MDRRLALLVASAVLIGEFGCEPARPPEQPRPAKSAASQATASASAPASRPASADSGPTSTPTSAPQLQPLLEVPEFIRIEGLDRAGRSPRMRATVAAGNQLILDTENITRFAIAREKLEMARDRSIVLRIDGQTMEWRANSPVREFVRSQSGIWEPVRP